MTQFASSGPLAPDQAAKIQQWASRYIPAPGDANLVKNRLLNGETVKVLTPIQVDVELTHSGQERVAKMRFLGINDAYINDAIVQQYPDPVAKQGMWGVVELTNTQDGVTLDSFSSLCRLP